MGRKELFGWSCTETLGIGIPNPRPVIKFPVPAELADKWAREAAERGVSIDEYVETLFTEVKGE